ncbi:MAG: hypothetical protein JO256_14095 [Alphaproteobacteria bacterium]|nr:hypothetical protein [Alphaproteobacteria bacterium]
MPALVTSEEVEKVVRETLRSEGYELSAARKFGETGTDIIATRGKESLHIECIAFKSSPPARAKDFYEIFFRATSRLSVGATLCVIALPARFGIGLHQRALASGEAWRRIGVAFSELEIWLVSTAERTIKRTSWIAWLKGEELI